MDAKIVKILNCKQASDLPTIPSTLYQKSNASGWFGFLKTIGLILLLVGGASWAVSNFSVFILPPLVICLGVQIYKLTIVLHDCAHNSFFFSRALNQRIGVISASFLGTDFHSFARRHMWHHKHNGSENDDEGHAFTKLINANRKQLLLQLFLPLTGVVFLKQILLKRPGKFGDGQKSKQKSSITIVLTQIMLMLLGTGAGETWWLFALYPATAATFGLFFSRLRGFSEHTPPAHWQNGAYTRTHAENWFDRLFFYDFGMNYHIEHHLYPSIPGHQLKHVHKMLTPYFSKDSCSGSMLKTIIDRVKAAG